MTSKNVAQAEGILAEGILRFPLEEKQFVFSYKKVVIMKKTLAAVAVLGAFAGSALAADVTLYGKVDLGLQYVNSNTDQLVVGGGESNTIMGMENVKKDSWGVKSGSNTGSRFGLKGTEQIADGLTVGFQLEQGFNADDGTLGADGLAFNREARLYVQTEFGEIGLGRMGGLDSGLGSYDLISKGYAFGTGWNSIGDTSAILLGESSRFDNMITYKSPTFAGVTVLAQASLAKTSVDEGEGSSDVDRYYALGATGNWGALSSALIFSTTDYSRTWVNAVDAETGVADKKAAKAEGREDMSKVLTGYVSYDFGVVKPMLAAQYFDDLKGMSASTVLDESADGVDGLNKWLGNISKKGYGVILGATAPLGAGTLFASVGYNDFESTVSDDVDGKIKFDTVQFGIGYQYPLSKRTYVYTAAGYTKLSGDFKEDGKKYDPETKTTEVVAGIVHNF